MAAQTPAALMTLHRHMGSAQTDFLHRAHIPAAVVKASSRRLDERQHVVIAAVHAVTKGDDFGRTVRQTHAEYIAVEGDGTADVGGENRDMRHAARVDAWCLAAAV